MGNRTKKILSVVGARPNIIKMAPIHKRLALSSSHATKIIHTGQHYDFKMSKIFFNEFDLPEPDYNLEVGSGTAIYQIGVMMQRLEKVYSEEQPDLVLVYGDTNSTLAGALSANKCDIPIGHVEAGLRSFDRSMPEEINRILTDHISDYLFAPTLTAAKNLRRENAHGRIFETGDLSVEIVSDSLKVRSDIVGELGLERSSYLLLTIHRAENTNSAQILRSLMQLMSKLDYTMIVFPIHPRTDKQLTNLGLSKLLESFKHVRKISPLGYIDFINLLKNATKVLTDSGGVQKEAYLLGTPCITLRSTTEWVETLSNGWNTLSEISSNEVVDKVKEINVNLKPRKSIFGTGNTSTNITRIITEIVEANS